MNATLEIQGLSRRFGSTLALDAVSLSVPAGQMVGIIGRSGAGKSTLLRMINRMAEPDAGRIRRDGQEVTALRGQALRDWRTGCAMIFQQFNLVGRLDVLTNVMIGRLNRRRGLLARAGALLGRFPDADRALALAALERFDLLPTALQRAETLSGGQQQRVAICRALLQQPHTILADEPIASLDPRNARTVMEALRAVNRRDGITVVVNLHHLDAAREFCCRIVGMQAGRVVFDGAPSQLTDAAVERIYGPAAPRPRRDAEAAGDAIPAARWAVA